MNLILALISLSSGPIASHAADTPFERVENDVVYFKAGASPSPPPLPPSLKTGLQDLKPLGLISSKSFEAVYLVASGKKCSDCPFTSGVFLIQTNPATPGRTMSLVHPGKVIDPKTGDLLLEARSFYGSCLNGKGETYLTFQKEKVDRRSRMQTSVVIIEVTPDGLHEKLLERGLPKLDAVLKLVKRKQCTEVEGRNRHSIPKGTKFLPNKADVPDDDSDDDPDPKENQTNAELKSP